MGCLIILLFSLQDLSKCGGINEKTCKFDKKSFDEVTAKLHSLGLDFAHEEE